MFLTKAEIRCFRNLIDASITPAKHLTLITGNNGSGKSSILEALYYLLTGTSYRTQRLRNIIHSDHESFILFGQLSSTTQHRIGIQRSLDGSHVTRLDGTTIKKRSDLVQLVPLQIITPESVTLLTEGAESRRSYLDWGLFHVEHSFYSHSANYNRALKQRNALLKCGDIEELDTWDAVLAEHGERITSLRLSYLDQLMRPLQELLEELLPDIAVVFHYKYGWNSSIALSEALFHVRETDLKNHFTSVGPHRGDLSVRYDRQRVSDVLSRGQLKVVTTAMKLAQLTQLALASSKTAIVIIDDLAAELDPGHRALLMRLLQSLSAQVIVSTPQHDLIDTSGWEEVKVFHVEHGQITEVV